MKSRLSELLSAVGYPRPIPNDGVILDITEDSREVRPGWIFVAIPGNVEDGSRYVSDAVARGASAIISQRTIEASVPVVVVPDARRTLADLAAKVHGFPSHHLTAFGVTGTDGKTTTSYLLASILEHAGSPTGMITTVETRAGGQTLNSKGRLTTPGAPYIQRVLAQMVSKGDRCAVIECSSHALAQQRLRNVRLRTAAITNIAEDHIQFHGSREAYAQTKASIFDLMPDSAPAFLNRDDPVSMSLAGDIGHEVITFGFDERACIRATDILATPGRTTFSMTWEGATQRVSLPIEGRFNVYNALAATGMATSYGIDLSTAAAGLENARVPAGRLQRIEAGQPFSIYVDYAHTEQAFGTVLEFLGQSAHARNAKLIAVFGAAGDRDRAKRPELARTASKACQFFVITNEDPFGEDASEIIAQVASGAPAANLDRTWAIRQDRREAIQLALSRAGSGDIVVITGKGHERSIAMGDTSVPWSDADVTYQLLAEVGYTHRDNNTDSLCR